jgi:hypothetical protein
MDSETLSLILVVIGVLLLIMTMSNCFGETQPKPSPPRCYRSEPFAPSNSGGNAASLPYGSDKRSAELAGSDYNQTIKNMSLEDDVQASHAEWLGEFSHRTTTASKETVRDDPNDVVTPIGLAAMMMRNCQYNSYAQPQEGSRTIPSDVPTQMGGPAPSMSFYTCGAKR